MCWWWTCRIFRRKWRRLWSAVLSTSSGVCFHCAGKSTKTDSNFGGRWACAKFVCFPFYKGAAESFGSLCGWRIQCSLCDIEVA